MKVQVQVFSFLRDFLPQASRQSGEVEVDLPETATLQDLFVCLGIHRQIQQDIFAHELNHSFQVLINDVAVNSYSQPLCAGDRVVLFPPMAGG